MQEEEFDVAAGDEARYVVVEELVDALYVPGDKVSMVCSQDDVSCSVGSCDGACHHFIVAIA